MRWMLLGIGLLLPVLTGCAGGAQRLAEREITRYARDYIGPADRYTADVRGLTGSRADTVTLVGTGVRPAPNVVLERLTLTLRGVQYRRDPFAVTQVDDAAFSVRVSEAAINNYLRGEGRADSPALRNVWVTLLPGEVRAVAATTVAGQAVTITAAGALQAQGATARFVPSGLAVAGVPVPASVLGLFGTLLNPLTDLRGLRFGPQITGIVLERGALTLSGRADPQKLVAAQP